MPVTSQKILSHVDHLVYATPDLSHGIAQIERLLGVRASPGGRHPQWGTQNALLALGSASYLEIIAPDPGQLPRAGIRPFGLDRLGSSRLVSWAAKACGLNALRAAAARAGVALGSVLSGTRQRPDGTILSWTLTDLSFVAGDGIVPFFIDWGSSPHPAQAAPVGATLAILHAEHPDADRVREMLRGLDLDLAIAVGPHPALIAEIDCANGRVLLR
jgi:Glyoxalase-like domain